MMAMIALQHHPAFTQRPMSRSEGGIRSIGLYWYLSREQAFVSRRICPKFLMVLELLLETWSIFPLKLCLPQQRIVGSVCERKGRKYASTIPSILIPWYVAAKSANSEPAATALCYLLAPAIWHSARLERRDRQTHCALHMPPVQETLQNIGSEHTVSKFNG